MNSNIIENIETFNDPDYWMGYKFIMKNQDMNITVKIANSRKCYEEWGMYTKSNLNEFIGAEYYNITLSDIIEDKDDEMCMLNITIFTNRGNIIIYFYNKHNGHYWHDVFIESKNINKFILL